jgi:hypothetical protein
VAHPDQERAGDDRFERVELRLEVAETRAVGGDDLETVEERQHLTPHRRGRGDAVEQHDAGSEHSRTLSIRPDVTGP